MNYILSIIIPIYNVKDYLEKSIESALSQKNDAFEVILVDDGSTDGCFEICEKYKDRGNVVIIHKKNGGLVSARKAGVNVAKGKYIGFLDGDDWVEDDYFVKMTDVIDVYNADVICSGYIRDYYISGVIEKCRNCFDSGIYKDGDIEGLKKSVLFNGKYFEFGIIPTVWSKIFKKEIINKWIFNIPESITVGEDVACSIPVLLDSKLVYIDNNNVGYHYRYVGSSMSRSFPPNRTNEVKSMLNYFSDVITGFDSIIGIKEQFFVYASFLIKHVIKGTARTNDYETLEKFTSDSFVKQCLKNAKSCSGIPIWYREMFSLLYNNCFKLTLLYYQLMLLIKNKCFAER